MMGKGLLLFGGGNVNAGLKRPAAREVFLYRNAQEGSCKLSWTPFCLHLSEVSLPGRTQVVQTGCSQSVAGSYGGWAQALEYACECAPRTAPTCGLFGSRALALASFRDDQKGVENIYTNRL